MSTKKGCFVALNSAGTYDLQILSGSFPVLVKYEITFDEVLQIIREEMEGDEE